MSDELAKTEHYAVIGEWLAVGVDGCTCCTPDAGMYGHESLCGYEPLAKVEDLRVAWNEQPRLQAIAQAAEALVEHDGTEPGPGADIVRWEVRFGELVRALAAAVREAKP